MIWNKGSVRAVDSCPCGRPVAIKGSPCAFCWARSQADAARAEERKRAREVKAFDPRKSRIGRTG